MADTFAKKALQQKKAKKKQDKAERAEARKANNNKGKSLEQMTAYLDENGVITDVPPDKQHKKKINTEDIQLGAAPVTREKVTDIFTGTVALFFADKAYGFITDDKSRESVFVHGNKVKESIKEKDRVSYKKEKTPKGYAAYDVEKIK